MIIVLSAPKEIILISPDANWVYVEISLGKTTLLAVPSPISPFEFFPHKYTSPDCVVAAVWNPPTIILVIVSPLLKLNPFVISVRFDTTDSTVLKPSSLFALWPHV